MKNCYKGKIHAHQGQKIVRLASRAGKFFGLWGKNMISEWGGGNIEFWKIHTLRILIE